MSNQTESPTTSLSPVLNWFEIPVSDVARSTKLYAAMLDRQLSVMDAPGHTMVLLGSNGCLVHGPNNAVPAGRGGTVVYLNAHDGVRACLSRAVEAGAKVIQGETSIGAHGTIALVQDLDGNVVGLHAELAK